jgi:hypothetical protein
VHPSPRSSTTGAGKFNNWFLWLTETDTQCSKVIWIGTTVSNGQTIWVSQNSLLSLCRSHTLVRRGMTMGPSPCTSVVRPSMGKYYQLSFRRQAVIDMNPKLQLGCRWNAILVEKMENKLVCARVHSVFLTSPQQGGYETDVCGMWHTDPGSGGLNVWVTIQYQWDGVERKISSQEQSSFIPVLVVQGSGFISELFHSKG